MVSGAGRAGGEDHGFGRRPALNGNLIATDVDGDDLTFTLNGDGDGEADYGTMVVNADPKKSGRDP